MTEREWQHLPGLFPRVVASDNRPGSFYCGPRCPRCLTHDCHRLARRINHVDLPSWPLKGHLWRQRLGCTRCRITFDIQEGRRPFTLVAQAALRPVGDPRCHSGM